MYPAVISGGAGTRSYSVGSPKRRRDGEGAIRMRKDSDHPHRRHYRPGGVPEERLGALGPLVLRLLSWRGRV